LGAEIKKHLVAALTCKAKLPGPEKMPKEPTDKVLATQRSRHKVMLPVP